MSAQTYQAGEIFEWDAVFTLRMPSSLSAARTSTMPSAQLSGDVERDYGVSSALSLGAFALAA